MWRHSLTVSCLFPPGQRGSSDSCQLPSCEPSPVSQRGSPLPRQRLLSEPWLAIHNLACLKKAHKEGMRKRSPHEEEDSDDREGTEEETLHFHQSRLEEQRDRVRRRANRYRGGNFSSGYEDFCPRVSQSLLSLTELSQATISSLAPKKGFTPGGSTLDKVTSSSTKLPACRSPHSHLRRNTLPSVTIIPPPLQLPPLVHQSDSHLQVPIKVLPSESRSMRFLPHPPSSAPPSSSSRSSTRPALLPSLPLGSSAASLVSPPAPCNKRSLRRHSVQLEHIRGGEDISAFIPTDRIKHDFK